MFLLPFVSVVFLCLLLSVVDVCLNGMFVFVVWFRFVMFVLSLLFDVVVVWCCVNLVLFDSLFEFAFGCIFRVYMFVVDVLLNALV